MTDAQLNILIDRVKPEICIAIRAILDGAAVHSFTLFDGTNSHTGVKTNLVMFVAHEAPAALLIATAGGLDEMAAVYQRIQSEVQGFLAKTQ